MSVTSPNFNAHDMHDGVPPKWWNRRIRTRAQLTEVAVMLGALSVISFWAAGLGVVAGLIAVAAALWADRSPDLAGDRAERTDTALALGTGILGTVVGMGFLVMVGPYW